MGVRSETLTYEADGLHMISLLYLDDAKPGKRPGVLVFPEAFGLGPHAKSRAERLAGLGYAALACDLHGDGAIVTGLEQVMGLIGPLRDAPDRIRARARRGFDALTARPEVDASKIAAIGFCFGGTMALELGRSGAGVAAMVGFHSGLATAAPQDAKNIKGKVLVCIGADDPGIPPEQRAAFEQEMRKGGVDWRLHLYGGVVHSFTNPDAEKLGRPDFARYDAGADARSWSEMLSLFAEVF
ncbi:MAG TPA: dienelactone hydrolase family protein [Stellaceae bacterium]|nr:dienelactone hydrolase family protein [Stellaceae bacterium]